jgi:hypothetical protein
MSKIEERSLKNPVIREYPDVFPEELPRLPRRREVEVTIKVLSGTTHISQAPHKMALV